MKLSPCRTLAAAAVAGVIGAHAPAWGEDIDLYSPGSVSATVGNPNVLFVIDNTDNWSRNDQKWDFGKQGESELRSLKKLIDTLEPDVNAGLMLFNDTKLDGGGYVRYAMRPMTSANKAAFKAEIDEILGNFNKEGAGSSADYGTVLFDVFKYFGGYTSPANAHTNIAGTPLGRTAFGTDIYGSAVMSKADSVAYTGSKFAPPGTVAGDCARNYVIFIGNGFPNEEGKSVPGYLEGIGGDSRQIPNVSDSNKLRYADEWARYLFKTDANAATGQQNIATYTINVFKDKRDSLQDKLMQSMARVGGGKYFEAKDEDAILTALKEILIEIQATDSVFASAALPVSASSRAEHKNEVFLGLFRPDSKASPRWYGNLKRYSLKAFGNYIDLADQYGSQAINPTTGFFSECSASWWTTDSGAYWASIPVYPSPASGCTLTAFDGLDAFSDAPDGPHVEKGGAAEVLRKGNVPSAVPADPKLWKANRNVKTVSGSSLTSFTTGSSGLSAPIVDFTAGKDVLDENLDTVTDQARPSIHGDVIHSRLLPITYKDPIGSVIYYGANDGTLRAVNAADGRERWAFVAPEHFPKLQRLHDNAPLVRYPSTPDDVLAKTARKDYFFDGPIGAYQTADASTSWIFPAMRRGGRMLYAFDVSNPDNPSLLWRKGCQTDDDTKCSGDAFKSIGQTWSMPKVAFVEGYDDGKTPLVVVGGGYDTCEDEDTSAPACSSSKGRTIFVLDAKDGTLLRQFTAPGMRAIASDVALVDVNYDGLVDYGYAADTGGNVWRIGFVEPDTNEELDPDKWTITRAAYTNGSGRKFLHEPALLATKGKVYVALGSGDREHPLKTDYPYAEVTNRFYVYLDDPSRATAHDLDAVDGVLDAGASALCTAPGVVPSGDKVSWFLDLDENGQGEQTVGSALIAGGLVVFNTNRPTTPVGSCNASLGEARGYWMNLLNGSGAIGVEGSCGGARSSAFVGGGLPPSPVRGSVRIDGHVHNIIISAVQRDGSVSSPIGGQKLVLPIKSRRTRIYWQQEGEQ